ncbi:site-specific integrase [Comamonas testosteroni]|nr:site-specific integrase [Comamonas testosteroni]
MTDSDSQIMDERKLRSLVADARVQLALEDGDERVQAIELEHAQELRRRDRERDEAVRIARLEGEHAGLLKALEARQRPIHVEVGQVASAAPVAPAAPLKPAPTLGGVVDAFLAQYEKRAGVTKDGRAMLKKHQKALPLLVELIGDKPVNELQQADINEFFSIVNALPPYWSDKCERRNLSVRELAALEHDETIAPKTFKESYVGCVRPFLEAAQRDYGDQGFPLTLTTKGIKYLGDVDEGASKQRAFKHHELQHLFAGAELQAFAADPKQHAKYWLPTLGLFTGARVNELCQLNPQVDILQEPETGIWYLWITTESEADSGIEKSVKTGESRKVPLHKKLIELGFLDYVSRIKASGAKRLFPVWKPAPDGKASPAAEKWFVRLIKKTGLRDETPKAQLVGMHSFRHTFLSYGTASKPSLNLGPITGHRQIAPGVSAVQAGYNDKSITDKLEDGQALLNQLDYELEFFKPA